MQRYNMIQAFFMSFYSRDLYRDVAKNWGGKAFLYLLMLIVVSWIGATILVQKTLNEGYKAYSAQITPQLPVLTFKDGTVSTPENRPYIIKNPSTQETLAVIDTSGQYTNLDQAKAYVLLTKTDFITRKSQDTSAIKTDPIPANLSMTVDPQLLNQHLKSYVGYAWIFIFIAGVIGSYIFRLIQALIYSVIGKIYSSMTNANVRFGEVLQIALVSITPAIVLNVVVNLVFFHAVGNGFILALGSFIVAMFYLFFGITANKDVNRNNEIKSS